MTVAGVNITPVSFLVINNGNIKLMPVEYCSTVDKIVDYIPDIIEKVEKFMECKSEEKNKEKDEQTIKYKFTDEDEDE